MPSPRNRVPSDDSEEGYVDRVMLAQEFACLVDVSRDVDRMESPLGSQRKFQLGRPRLCRHDRPAEVWPRKFRIRSSTSPTTLSGVEAPAVRPIVTGPSGSQAVVWMSAYCFTGRCRIASFSMPSALSIWNVGR